MTGYLVLSDPKGRYRISWSTLSRFPFPVRCRRFSSCRFDLVRNVASVDFSRRHHNRREFAVLRVSVFFYSAHMSRYLWYRSYISIEKYFQRELIYIIDYLYNLYNSIFIIFSLLYFSFSYIVIRVLWIYVVCIYRVPESKRVTGIPSLRTFVLAFRNATNRDAGEDVHVR